MFRGGYSGCKGLQGVTRGYKVAWGYLRLDGVTVGYKGYKRFQGVTRGYRGYKWLHEVTKGYKRL